MIPATPSPSRPIRRRDRFGVTERLDERGRTVAQAELIPMQPGTIGRIFGPCAALFPPETLGPDDVLVISSPYSGGQHLQDVFIFHPIHVDGRVIGLPASVAHHLDLGGGSPGLTPAAAAVYSEGLVIPPMKINLKRDWHGGGFERLLRANVRAPHQAMGDFDAQMAANAVGVMRVQEMARRYGAEKIEAAMAALQDYPETRMRAAIRSMPDGVHVGEEALDDDGEGDAPVSVRATVTVAGDSAHVDCAGTDPQVRLNLNAPSVSTTSAAVSALKAFLSRRGRQLAQIHLLHPGQPGPARAGSTFIKAGPMAGRKGLSPRMGR